MQMPRIRLVVQNAEGHYGTSTHAPCCMKGHMLIYDLGRNFSEWVPMRGVSSSLTLVELRSANDLNNICPYPHSEGEFPKGAPSPKLVHSRPAGDETDSDSWKDLPHPQTLRSRMNPSARQLVMLPNPTCQRRGSNMGRNYQ